jgi:tetratricopeptide (TPR) repeat protein
MAKWRHKKKVLSISAGILIPTLMVMTWTQVGHWKNSITIFKHDIKVIDKKYPNFAIIYNNLGIALFADGKNEEAISHYKMAIRLNPNYTNAHYNLGIILLHKGALKEAVYHFRETVRLRPEFIKARDYLKFALLQSRELK